MAFESAMEKINKARKEAQQDRETAKDLATQVQDAITLLDLAKKEDRETQEHLRKEIADAQGCLTENRQHLNPTIRRSVWKAMILWTIHPFLSVKKDAEEMIAKLVSGGFMVEDPKGTLAVLGKSYSIPTEALFEEVDVKEMEEQFALFQERVRAVLKNTANLMVKELVACGKGHMSLFVPPQKYTTQDGSTKWRAGGTLMLESDGRFVRGVDATGKIENVIAEIKKLEAKLLANLKAVKGKNFQDADEKTVQVKVEVRSLRWNKPPRLPFTDDNDSKEVSSKTQLLWYLITRGVDFSEWVDNVAKKATLTEREFFLEGKPGKHFLDLEEAWQDFSMGKEPIWISRPVMLVERLEKDGKSCIQLPEVPAHHEDWLKNCRECTPEGEQFTGLAQPLQSILRHCWGKAQKNADKETAVQVANEIIGKLSPT